MREHLSDWLFAAVAIAIALALGVVLDIDYAAFVVGPIAFVVTTAVVGLVLELVRRTRRRST